MDVLPPVGGVLGSWEYGPTTLAHASMLVDQLLGYRPGSTWLSFPESTSAVRTFTPMSPWRRPDKVRRSFIFGNRQTWERPSDSTYSLDVSNLCTGREVSHDFVSVSHCSHGRRVLQIQRIFFCLFVVFFLFLYSINQFCSSKSKGATITE